jgi:hypothetical protein
MNNRRDFIRFLILGGALVPTASLFGAELAANAPAKLNVPPDVRRFVAEKERQVKALAGKHQVELWPEVLEFFDLAGKQAWPDASEVYRDLKQSVSYPRASADEDRVGATALQAALEVELALEQFAEGEPNLTPPLGGDCQLDAYRSVYLAALIQAAACPPRSANRTRRVTRSSS